MPLSPSSRPTQAEIIERFATFRRETRPPPASPPCAAEAADHVRAARHQARLAGWPLLGPAARAVGRLWQVWRTRDMNWRQKLRATPGLGAASWWLWSLLQLGGFRTRTLEQLSMLACALESERAARIEREAALARSIAEALSPRTQGQTLPTEVYLALEARLRGDDVSVAQRLRAYLPFARRAAQLGLPAADLGCGRGEWLACLAAEGIPAVGVDSNAAMVAACRAKGLAADEGDALAWLLERAPGSLALVSLFQVAEHLPVGTLFAWLRAAWRALAPGGLLVVETPNPENLQVAAYSFWLDPTHRHPLPPPLLDVLVTAAGFTTFEVLRLAPWPELAQEDDAYPPYLRKLLFCAQDYGLVAEKPREATA